MRAPSTYLRASQRRQRHVSSCIRRHERHAVALLSSRRPFAVGVPALFPLFCLSLLCLLLCLPTPGAAQSTPAPTPADTTRDAPPPIAEPEIERFIDLGDSGEEDGERTTEHVMELRARPIDINSASAQDLSAIPSLSLIDAQRIVRYRSAEGPFSTLPDLINVDGVSESDYRAIRPFITLRLLPNSRGLPRSDPGTGREPGNRVQWRDALTDPDVRVSYRWSRDIDLGKGYSADTSTTGYLGGPVRHVVRADARFGDHLRIAGALDQDPGEKWRWDPAGKRPGFDHMAGAASIQNIGPLDRLVVGDFTVSSGHGVGLWRGLAFGKGRDPTSGVIRSGRGVRPFASTEENRFFRGSAASVHLTDLLGYAASGVQDLPLRLTGYAFISRRQLDASWDIDPSMGIRRISTVPASGLHRTATEAARRDAVRESVVGGGMDIEARIGPLNASGGLSSLSSSLDAPLRPTTRPDQAFDRQTSALTVNSMYVTLQWNNLLVTGEGARLTSASRGTPLARYAGVVALAYDDGRRMDAVLHLRSFGRGYDNPYGAAFNETSTQNERGVYGGVRVLLHRTLRVSGYIDQYAFKWLRFNVSRPTVGRDTRLVVEYEPRRWLSHMVEMRSETKEERGAGTAPSHSGRRSPVIAEPVMPGTRRSLRFDTDVSVSPSFSLATEVQASRTIEGDPENQTQARFGWLMVQRLNWQIHPRVSLTGSMALFDTSDFSTRLYTYERDLRYAFSVPALFGQGERSYALARIKLHGGVMVEAKYSVTRYDDRNQIRSGLQQLSGNRIRSLGVQLHWRL